MENKKANFGKKMNPETYGKGVTASGRLSWDIDDETAQILRGKTIEETFDYVSEQLEKFGLKSMSWHYRFLFEVEKIEFNKENIKKYLQNKYEKHNIGLKRAFLGTLLRKAKRRIENQK